MVTKRFFFLLSFVAWLLACIAGTHTIWRYEANAGIAAKAPLQWPSDSTLVRHESDATMLVWLHPRCPCSNASVGELERLLVRLPEDVTCQVVMTHPETTSADFTETKLTKAVRRLPRVSLRIDESQHETRRFGVSTSGQVLLYDQKGDLVYSGGITASRGHGGDNPGSSVLKQLFQGGDITPPASTCSVYGCELMSSEKTAPMP